MRRSASEIIKNLETRIARLERKSTSHYNVGIKVDEFGELVDPEGVASKHIDLDDIAYEMYNDDDFRDLVEDKGEDLDDISYTDLDVGVESSSAGRRSRKDKDIFYFFIEETDYGFAAIVSIDLDLYNNPNVSIDHIGEYSSSWRLFNRWT